MTVMALSAQCVCLETAVALSVQCLSSDSNGTVCAVCLSSDSNGTVCAVCLSSLLTVMALTVLCICPWQPGNPFCIWPAGPP